MTEPTAATPRQTTKMMRAVADLHAKPSVWWRWPVGLGFIAWSFYERHAHPASVPVDARDFWVFHFGLLTVGVSVLPGVKELVLGFAKGGAGVWQTVRKGKDT